MVTSAQVYIGATAGTRGSWQNYEDFSKEDFKRKPFFGYSAGVSAGFKVEKRYLLQVDILYSRQGKKIQGVTDPLLENTGIYHFLNTPIVYKIEFKETLFNRDFKWFVGAGPNINFWLKGKGTLINDELVETTQNEIEYDIKFEEYPNNAEPNMLYVADANRLQLGLILSTGVVFEPAAGHSISVDLRYEWGHSYMAEGRGVFEDVFAYEDDFRASIQGVQLSVTYLFDIISKGKKEKKIYFK